MMLFTKKKVCLTKFITKCMTLNWFFFSNCRPKYNQMSKYNLSIQSLDFDFGTLSFNLSIKVEGDEFPTPSTTTGSLSNGTINFSMESSGSETCNSATFTFQTNTILSNYTFTFSDIPEAANISGNIGSSANSDLFEIESCNVVVSESGKLRGDVSGNGDIGIGVRKKPGTKGNYSCVSCGLNSTNTSVLLTFVTAEEDNLTGSVEGVPGNLLTSGLGISTQATDGNPEPTSISEFSFQDQ